MPNPGRDRSPEGPQRAPRKRSRVAGTDRETNLGKTRRARRIDRTLAETYPYAVAELDFTNAFELLVATVLSAQTTDVRVNDVTPALFARYPDAAALAAANEAELQTLIQPTGFFRAKARSLLGLAQALMADHDGVVPGKLEDLVKLPGVGRKTANVVLGNAFGVPGLTVDTHFGRLCRRLGLTESEDPVQVEKDIAQLIEKREWTDFSHRLIYHGRRVCHSRKPACGVCVIADLCPSFGVGEEDPVAAERLLKYELAPGREELLARFEAGATRRELRAAGWSLSA